MIPASGPDAGIPPGWSVRDGATAVLVAQIALIFGGSAVVALGGWGVDDVPIGATLAATAPFWVAIGVAAAILVRRHGSAGLRGASPRPLDAASAVAVGVAGQLLAVPALYWVVFRLTSYDSADLEEPARRLGDAATGTWGAVVLVLLAGLGAPFFEEVLYRGVFQTPLVERIGGGRAVVASAVVFAVFHFQPLQLPGLLALGLAAGWFRLRRGGLICAVLVHASFNLVTVVDLLR